jgi:hypothetical protein
MLGYENKYLNLYHLNKEYNKDNKILNNQDIETIVRERSNNLRHVIIRTQSIIYGIINKTQITNIYNNDEKKLVTEFNTKIKSINTRMNQDIKIFLNTIHILLIN